MRATLLFLSVCLLAGCASSGSRAARFLPWNWFSPDRVAQLEAAQADTAAAERSLVKSSQEDVRAAGKALAGAPAGREVETARSFIQRADTKLAEAVGPLTVEQDANMAALVAKLVSENAELRAAGAAEMARRDARENSLSRDLASSREREGEITEKLKVSDLRYQAQAEKYRRLIFWVVAGVAGWILLQVVAGAAKFYPGLAPIARVAGYLSGPVLQTMNDRLHTATGRAIASAEKASGALAAQFREHLDAAPGLDEDNQAAIRRAYEAAARPG